MPTTNRKPLYRPKRLLICCSVSLPYFFKYLFKENEDFSVFGFILLNIMWNNQRAIHLVALTTLTVLSILCHPFTIYCTKKIIFLLALHFERIVERLRQYDLVISKRKAGKKTYHNRHPICTTAFCFKCCDGRNYQQTRIHAER